MKRTISALLFLFICAVPAAAQPASPTEPDRRLFSEAAREWEAESGSLLSAGARSLLEEDWITARTELRTSTPKDETHFDKASKAGLSRYLTTQLMQEDPIPMTVLIAIELGNKPVGVTKVGRFGAIRAPSMGFAGQAQLTGLLTPRISLSLNAGQRIIVVVGEYRYSGKSSKADCSGQLIVTVGNTSDLVCPVATP